MPTQTETDILTVAEALGLTMSWRFVPWSQSRNRLDLTPSLNWRIRIVKDGKRDVLECDYSAGCAHAPSYRPTGMTVQQDDIMRTECNMGTSNRDRKPIAPSFPDVLSSLVSDAEALIYPTFEDWAESYGYDTDSRKAEETYRACLDIGLRLRAAIGEDGLNRLRGVCERL